MARQRRRARHLVGRVAGAAGHRAGQGAGRHGTTARALSLRRAPPPAPAARLYLVRNPRPGLSPLAERCRLADDPRRVHPCAPITHRDDRPMPVKNRFAELLPEITAWRRDLHENPELLFEVHRTAGKVAGLLRGFGCDEVVEGIGQTGVVGVIRGRTDTKGRVIGLRADMDALPIIEQTGLPYASKTQGKMHACGHDGHTAMLLGAAKYLAETRNFDGTAVVIFQPAEEGGGGGREMVKDGMMERWGIQEVYGMHNMPGIPVGTFAIREGAMMAAADQFDVIVTGKGGHAAKPQDCIDTTLVAAHIVLALQSIASRNVDPLKQVVVSVCTFRTESEAYNVIP